MAGWADDENFMMEMRPAEEVAARCLVLCCVVAHQEDPTLDFEKWLKREDVWRFVTPHESAFLTSADPSDRDIRNFGWRSEAVLMLMWCLGKVGPLPPPVQTGSFSDLLSRLPEPEDSTREFLEDARLRPLEEVIVAYEEVYGQHWAVRDARLHRQPTPEGLEPGVIYERHYALNWLRRYGVFEEQEWDNVTTDT